MFGFGSREPVAEHQAEGEIERVYHQIRRTLRVTGVNLIFRKWASQKALLPVIWDAIQPIAETFAFERAADQLRIEAARSVEAFGTLDVFEPQDASAAVRLGESQAYQIRSALEMYHYINPKLLLVAAIVGRALQGETGSSLVHSDPAEEFLRLGVPVRMHAMEMVDPQPDDERLRDIFSDIQQTMALESINSDYRTLALWPDYLAAAWSKLKPVVQRSEFGQAANLLRELARTLAAGLPSPAALSRDTLEAAGADFDKATESTQAFERLLPGLILNVALCLQDWHRGEALARSPFPAEVRPVRSERSGK